VAHRWEAARSGAAVGGGAIRRRKSRGGRRFPKEVSEVNGATGVGWQYAAAGSSEPPLMAGQEHHPQLHGGVGRAAADSGSEGSEMQLGDQDDDDVDDGKP
jgi:hypothetical protein